LGVVYTPNEIVKFMIESTTYLLHKHFGKTLSDKNVEILDPATGTGTFISDIIDHIPKQHLAYKYKHELHANEVAILPYYISNLNIEFTFKQKMGYYEEFTNSCFVDTLDNISALSYAGKQHSLFGFSSENAERIKKQNAKTISVIIGNPPYNANQKNENENNKNREYPTIDKRIKETFIKNSTAQKTKVYDMYARFYRWAMDRVDKNGIVAFITNRSFIDSRTFDGFRKIVQEEFSNCYIIDTRSDVRANPKIAGTTHNVFGIQTGVAVMFLIKKENKESKCRIEYTSMEDDWRKEIKLDWFRNNRIGEIAFANIIADKNNNWINLNDNNWEVLINVANSQGKFGRGSNYANSIFSIINLGISTNRDEWAYDLNFESLKNKIAYFGSRYNSLLQKDDSFPDDIKWSNALKVEFKRGKAITANENSYKLSLYRPFTKEYFFSDKTFNDALNLGHYELFGPQLDAKNPSIIFTGPNSGKPFMVIVSDSLFDLHVVGAGAGAQCLPLYRYTSTGERIDNITDWGLQQFQQHYTSLRGGTTKQSANNSATDEQIAMPPPSARNEEEIIKEDIFHYTYAVLHHPAYRKKYELNLKREFPRIPFYENFFQWRDWGKQLMDLHINYETVQPYNLTQHNYETKTETKKQKEIFSKVEEPEVLYTRQLKLKVKLKADKASGIIEIDELTFLRGIPKEAWEYKLGNRSALEWILDQYKEKKPSDPTIAEKFNTYKFADYKEKVIDLLKRVCTVSVETMKVVRDMEGAKEENG
jgi:predicted helicase